MLFLCSVSDDNDTECSVDESGQRWTCASGQSNFSCSVDDSGHRISCQDEQHCPYAEESQQIHITVYVKTKYFLVENYSRYFYLSEMGAFLFYFIHNTALSFICSCLCFHLTPSSAFTLDSET